jgi:periplasmic glucans biosynthesis protein
LSLFGDKNRVFPRFLASGNPCTPGGTLQAFDLKGFFRLAQGLPYQGMTLPFSLPLAKRSSRCLSAGAWLTGAVFMLCAPQAFATTTHTPFSWEQLGTIAAERAQTPWRENSDTLPAEVQGLSYDQLRDIRFNAEQSTWRDRKLPFEVQYFHLGLYQKQPVRMNEVTDTGQVKPIAYSGALFNYGANPFNHRAWGDLGFAGMRLHYPLNSAAYKDELAVFLGASYFRMLGRDQQYGLSARGLALDTVGGQGEEFPRFTEFWLQRPATGAQAVTVFALMESPRATGAFRFVIRPGTPSAPNTTATVSSRIYLRAGAPAVNTLGVAPLTSMFLFGENQPMPNDFRPEVHDSDGLMLHTDGASGQEWLWRPLQRPASGVLVNSFSVERLQGLGLMQRDRRFENYEDVEARYERRPSAWIQPLGDWGRGRVELVQLAIPDETHDNVVAYWVPEKPASRLDPIAFDYNISWQGEAQQRPPASWVTQSRVGYGYTQLSAKEQATQPKFVLDFAGPALDALPPGAELRAVVSADANGRVLEAIAYPNPATRTWRAVFRVTRIDAARPVELRAFLQHQDQSVSETWTHLLLPQ